MLGNLNIAQDYVASLLLNLFWAEPDSHQVNSNLWRHTKKLTSRTRTTFSDFSGIIGKDSNMMASQAGRSGSSGESSSWRVFSSRPLANEAWTGFCGQIWRWGAATGTEQGGGGQFDGRGDDPGPTAGSSSLFPSFSNMMLTARELVLLYRDMLAVPLMDACPPKLWLIFARDPERHGYPSPLLPGARPMQVPYYFLPTHGHSRRKTEAISQRTGRSTSGWVGLQNQSKTFVINRLRLW